MSRFSHRSATPRSARRLTLESLETRQLMTVAPAAIGCAWTQPVPASVVIGDATVTEGDSGSRNAEFTISASGTYSTPITVSYATRPRTATEVVDFSPRSGTVTFQPTVLPSGCRVDPQPSRAYRVLVPVLGDRQYEPDEQFEVVLLNANVRIADDTGVGTIRDNEVNQPPVAVDDRAATNGEPILIDVLANDRDDGVVRPLQIKSVSQSLLGTVDQLGNLIRFTPDANRSGIARFTYVVTDGENEATGRVEVTVNCIDRDRCNRRPVTVPDHYVVLPGERTQLMPPFMVNDTDPDGDPLSFAGIVLPPLHGQLKQDTNDPNVWWYTPDAGFAGDDAFQYAISDGREQGLGNVTLTVGTKPSGPQLDDDFVNVVSPGRVSIPVLENDVSPSGGELRILSFDTMGGRVTRDLYNQPNLLFEAKAGEEGLFKFTYRVTDDRGGEATATVHVKVQKNLPPAAVDDVYATGLNNAVILDLLANDIEPNGESLHIGRLTGPKHGTLERVGDSPDRPGQARYRYRPDPGFRGVDSFTYRASDSHGTLSNAAKVKIDVGNRRPDAINDAVKTKYEQPVEVPVLKNDWDADGDKLQVVSFTQGAHGTVEPKGLNRPNVLVYRPHPGTAGVDSFTYTISDGRGKTTTATVRITVAGPLSIPLAPASLIVSQVGRTAVTIKWQDVADNEKAHRIAISTDGQNWENAAVIAANKQSYRVTGLRPNTRYFFKIRAANDAGFSEFSNVIEVRTRS